MTPKKKKTENEPSVRCLFQIKTGHNFVVLQVDVQKLSNIVVDFRIG